MSVNRNILTWLLKGSTLLLGAVGTVVLLSAVKTKDSKPCKAIEISRANATSVGFVTDAYINQILKRQLGANPIGTALYRFDLGKIEAELESSDWIEDVQMYFDNNQVLHILLSEAIPVARVFDDAGKSFYLDKQLNELPLSSTWRADLPVFTRVPARRNTAAAKDLMNRISKLAEVIVADSFWLAQAAQIEVIDGKRFELIPLIGNHTVDLGQGDEPLDMLRRLKAFYIAIANAGRLNDYRVIKAEYNGQIVAQLHKEAINYSAQQAVLEQFKQIVNKNKIEVNAASVTNENIGGRIVDEEPRITTNPNKDKPEKQTVQVRQLENDVPKNNIDKDKAGEDKIEVKQAPTPANEQKQPEKKVEQVNEKRIPKAVMPKIDKN
jgi:cell division protein FtsQ